MKGSIMAILCNRSFVTRAELLIMLSHAGERISDRQLRKAVEELVMDDGCCIASTENGYHLIKSEHELRSAVDYLRRKAQPIAIRANQLIKNYKEVYGNQLNLTFNL
jgi:hypothetical protein